MVLPLVVILIAAAILFYRYTLPPLPRGRRFILSTLRALTLLLLVIVVSEPVVRMKSTSAQQPTVAVLIDDSQSMTINDGSKNRAALVREFLKENDLHHLTSGVEPRFFLFSSKLEPATVDQRDSISFKGQATNLAETFIGLKEMLSAEHIQAAVLVTDGNYTVGKNPVYDAEELGIPVSTVGVGDTTEHKDLLIEKVATNNIAYAGTKVPIDATVKSSGFKGENVEVSVSEGAQVVDRAVLMLQEGTREYPVRLHVEPMEEGTKKYIIGVSNLPGELTNKNNAHTVFMKVLKSKLRVLIIAGKPGPDVAAARQIFAEDERLRVQTLVQKQNNEFYEGEFSAAALDSADCMVLVGFPSQATSNATVQLVRNAVEQKKKPLLFLNDKMIDYAKHSQLEPLLPFGWTAISTAEVEVFPHIIERQKANSLVTLEGNASPEVWEQLPPLYKTMTVFRAKPESDVLAAVKFQNIILNEPLILTRNINGQKSFAITGYGVWRWRLMAQGDKQTEKFLTLLLTNAVRWLTTEEDNKNVSIVPTKESYTTTEPVEFTAQVYDDQLRPVDNADVKIQLQRGKESFDVVLHGIGNGRYEGATEGLGEGDFTFIGRATSGGKVYGEDKGRFTVGETDAEFLETRMNKTLLEQIAFHTGGKYYYISNTSDMISDLNKNGKFFPKELIQTSEIELWNWQYLAAFLVLLLGIEWFMRKRSGML